MRSLSPAPYFLALVCAFLVACASAGLPAPQTLNEKVAVAQASVTQMRATATVLLNAKKISSADAVNVLKQTDAAAEGIVLAALIGATNPAAADAKLQTTLAVLSALQAYLAAKGN